MLWFHTVVWGGGGRLCGKYLWVHHFHTKSQFRNILSRGLDWWERKDRYVLINRPLTHLEKWIKGFVRNVLSWVADVQAYLSGLGVCHLLPNKALIATLRCLLRVPPHIRADWIRHPRQYIHNAVLLLGGFGSLLSHNTLLARTFPWSVRDYIYPRLRHLADSTSYPTVCT